MEPEGVGAEAERKERKGRKQERRRRGPHGKVLLLMLLLQYLTHRPPPSTQQLPEHRLLHLRLVDRFGRPRRLQSPSEPSWTEQSRHSV